MSTVMLDSGAGDSTPPRCAKCPKCDELWPAVLATCPHDGAQLVLCSPSVELEPDVGARVGDYTITGVLGAGGMSTVYAAVHPLIGKKVAIKVLARHLCRRREAVLRFVQEARSVNQIGHPNIVDIFSFGTLPDGRCFQIMEWLQGETLAQRLQDGALSFSEKVQIATQICDALEAVHARGFVHRDLKPENIFLVAVEEGRVAAKLLDFGIAKLCATDAAPPNLTRPEIAMGTPQYVSPEQARGKPVEARSDVYALGIVLYEMFVGRLPFVADSTVDFLVKHVSETPVEPSLVWPTIPSALEKLLLRMLAKAPAERPHVTDVRAELAYILHAMSIVDLEEVAPPPPSAPQPALAQPEPPSRWRWMAMPLSVAGLAAALLVAGSPPPAEPAPPAPIMASSVHGAPSAPRVEIAPAPTPVAIQPVLAPAPAAPDASLARPPTPKTRSRARAPSKVPIDEQFLVDPFTAPRASATPRTR